MMDHCAAAYGGVIAIDFMPEFAVEPLEVDLGEFVLGDSGEPKDTKGILSSVKERVLDAVQLLRRTDGRFSLADAESGRFRRGGSGLDPAQEELLGGTIRNRDITREARALLRKKPLDRLRLGGLLSEHQSVLRDVLGISTTKIDSMLDAAAGAGAYGGKINGSGGGGCMFAYAPSNPEKVAEAVARAGGKPHIIKVDTGTRRGSGSAAT
jgi:galactokinase